MTDGICDAKFCRSAKVISHTWGDFFGKPRTFEWCAKHFDIYCDEPGDPKRIAQALADGKLKEYREERKADLERAIESQHQELETMAASDRKED